MVYLILRIELTTMKIETIMKIKTPHSNRDRLRFLTTLTGVFVGVTEEIAGCNTKESPLKGARSSKAPVFYVLFALFRGCSPGQVCIISCGLISMLLCATAEAADRQVLRGHVPSVVAKMNLQPVGRPPATNRLYLAIGLPLRNTNDLNKLLQDMYNPASPQFRHYLTPEQFTERFGPTRRDYDAVAKFARSHGLEITVMHPNRVLLDVAGKVADMEKAFQITLRTFKHPTEARQFYAPDVEPSVEAGLAVLDISGLDNYTLPRRARHKGSLSASPHPLAGSGTGGTYLGKDFRNAYVPGVSLDGSGQMLGLVEFAAYFASDIATYEGIAHLPKVPLQNVLLDGFDGTSTEGNLLEAPGDIEVAVSMAPGLAKIVVFNAGPSGIWNDVVNSMAENPQIKQLSSSWGFVTNNATADQIFQEIILQGQSFLQASGDSDAQSYSPGQFIWPQDDPYVTSVGGTSLTMNGAGTSYVSETVWNDASTGVSGQGSGGGISEIYPIPSWQQGLDMSANGGSTSMRNFPDVATVAEDFFEEVMDGEGYAGGVGTSFAAPLWAAFTALVNQEAAAHGEPAAGFLNPALYSLGRSSNYTNCFHDITTGNNATSQSRTQFPAVPGYDLCTGWGRPEAAISLMPWPCRCAWRSHRALLPCLPARLVGRSLRPCLLSS